MVNDDRVLRVQLLQPLQVEQLAQTSHDFRQVLRLHGVRQIESSYDLLVIVAPFLRLIRQYENDVLGYRLHECLALHRHDVERLLQRHVAEVHGDTASGEVWVIHNRQPGDFPDRVKNDLRVVHHVQADRSARERFNLRRQGRQRCCWSFGCSGRRGISRSRLVFLLGEQIRRLPDFLIRDRARRIHRCRSLKLSQRRLQVALLAQLHTLLDMKRASLKPRLIELDLILGVLGLFLQRLLIEVVRRIVITGDFRPCVPCWWSGPPFGQPAANSPTPAHKMTLVHPRMYSPWLGLESMQL